VPSHRAQGRIACRFGLNRAPQPYVDEIAGYVMHFRVLVGIDEGERDPMAAQERKSILA